ncbi:MAG: twin-arginine translocase TatA/TatE family subunit [Nitrospiraceae bacterium]
MFGTMGFSELIIILVIILIIFGAGRLPQIGEGVGKALRGFKKEVQEPMPVAEGAVAPDATAPVQQEAQVGAVGQAQAPAAVGQAAAPAPAALRPTAPYTPGPELTPGTTAAMMAAAAPQVYKAPPKQAPITVGQPIPSPLAAPTAQAGQAPPTMEERMAQPVPTMRASYPPLPPTAQAKPVAKRPSAIVNKDAVARVQAQQAAIRSKGAAASGGLTPDDMGNFGQGLGEAFRMMKDVTAEVRGAIDPQVRTLRAEVDAATKEIEQSIEAAKELPAVQEEAPAKSV